MQEKERRWEFDTVEIGQEGRPVSLQITKELIRQYARSVRNDNPAYDLQGERSATNGKQEAMPALKILETVTVDAAEAIGMADHLGTVAPGYLADLVLINYEGLHTAPSYSLLDNVIYCCTGRDVDTVVVNGQTVVRGGKLMTLDEAQLVEQVERTGRALMRRALDKEADLAWLWRSTIGTEV